MESVLLNAYLPLNSHAILMTGRIRLRKQLGRPYLNGKSNEIHLVGHLAHDAL